MALSNADKHEHGAKLHNSLEQILEYHQKHGYIQSFKKNYYTGKAGYSDTKQFYAPILVTLNDNTCWAVFSTTSFRSDRINGKQWNAYNLKGINPAIKKAFLVYPDAITTSEKKNFISHRNQYTRHEEYSAIDDILSQEELSNLIESTALAGQNAGHNKAVQGNNFEQRVVSILTYEENLTKWKTGAATLVGLHYDIFLSVMECFGLDSNRVQAITATADKKVIGRLPSGGNPKTDVIVTVYFVNDTYMTFTISCKRTNSKSVSVHQYTADAFADVLDEKNIELRQLLNAFQKVGNLRDFGKDNGLRLAKLLAPFHKALAFWALGGFGGEGTKLQCASYILTYDDQTSTAAIYTIEGYYNKLLDAGTTGNFGTLFAWTFPSKQRGKYIQLKCKIPK